MSKIGKAPKAKLMLVRISDIRAVRKTRTNSNVLPLITRLDHFIYNCFSFTHIKQSRLAKRSKIGMFTVDRSNIQNPNKIIRISDVFEI